MMILGVFLLSALFILYVLAGYPLLLALRARHPNLIHSAPLEPTVTVLLPVFNGEKWITGKLESIRALDYPAAQVQILVISDGSTDNTVPLARAFSARNVTVLEVPNAGKSAALNTGLAHAQGEILFFTDVRQPLDPQCLRYLTACFADPQVGAASGELVILKGENQEQASVGLYWRYEKWMRKRLSQIDSVMGATGAIYAMRRGLARPLPPDTLLDDVYLPLIAFLAGYRVVFEERAIAYDYPTSLDSEFGRKVRTQAGVYQLVLALPQMLTSQNRQIIDFVSHKLGRLMLPFALILLALSSFGLPPLLRALALTAQAAFYGIALLDPYVPEGSVLKRLSAPIRTFTVLMLAALFAVSIFFRSSRSFWKQATGAGKV